MATIADNRCDRDFLTAIFSRGATQVRINSAHVTPERLAAMAEIMRGVNPQVRILTDTKGPEVRTTDLAGGLSSLAFSRGSEFAIVYTGSDGSRLTDHSTIAVGYGGLRGKLTPGSRVLIDDGEIELEVCGYTADGDPLARALADGILLPRKGISFVGADLSDLPAVTPRDEANLRMAARLGLDMVAHSFVRSADDVRAVRRILLSEPGGERVKLYAKIESLSGVKAFGEIMEQADGILIARGDLGTELPPELIPSLQRAMTERCLRAGKPVIVATQFLQSMIDSPHATRAEMTDIATAVGQGVSTLLLCGETAAGRYPLEAVATMKRAIDAAGFDVSELLG